MRFRLYNRWFKFSIMTMDLGWCIGIRFNNWACRIPVPIPLEKGTIRFSIRQQGLFGSILHRCHVPPTGKEEVLDLPSDIARVLQDNQDYKPVGLLGVRFFFLDHSPKLERNHEL